MAVAVLRRTGQTVLPPACRGGPHPGTVPPERALSTVHRDFANPGVQTTPQKENPVSDTTQDPTAQRTTINEWIAAMNAHDTAAYLEFFTEDGVLDDPSVGRVYNGRSEIIDYFESYFIGYNTQTQLVSVEPQDDYLHVEVAFTGSFPGGQTGGIFDVTLAADQKIERVRADLA